MVPGSEGVEYLSAPPMRRLLSLVMLTCTLAAPAVAHADDAAVSEAQARFKEGLALSDRAKFEEARLKFLQAYAVVKAPSVTFNLALAEQKTGHEVDAVGHYRAFLVLSANDTRVTDAQRDKARANIGDLTKKVGQIDIDAPEGTKISVDGAPVESTRDPVPVTAGKHAIEGTYSGRVKSTSVEAKLGEITKAMLTFEEPVAAATPSPMPPVTEPPAEPPPHRTTAGWVVPVSLGILGVAGIATGIGMSAASQSSKDDYIAMRQKAPGLCADRNSQPCRDYDDKRSSSSTQSTVGVVGYAAGSVLLAGAVASWFLWPKSGKSAPQQGLTITPLVGLQGGGADIKLTF